MATANQVRFDALLSKGDLIETASEMTPEYLKELKHTLTVSGDTELISAPAYYLAAQRAPSVNAFMTGIAIIQDELAHAHIAYHILEELGDDEETLIFERDPKSFRYPYAFDVPLESWTELAIANAMYDQAGFCLLGDIHEACSYGPWKRGLVKVMAEENFHLRNGQSWMKKISKAGGEAKSELQRNVDWMFPL
ncbi:MAG: phenylacetate-CoA oxygenase subunit PaaI, partial [Chloroflexi bacterium]